MKDSDFLVRNVPTNTELFGNYLNIKQESMDMKIQRKGREIK